MKKRRSCAALVRFPLPLPKNPLMSGSRLITIRAGMYRVRRSLHVRMPGFIPGAARARTTLWTTTSLTMRAKAKRRDVGRAVVEQLFATPMSMPTPMFPFSFGVTNAMDPDR